MPTSYDGRGMIRYSVTCHINVYSAMIASYTCGSAWCRYGKTDPRGSTLPRLTVEADLCCNYIAVARSVDESVTLITRRMSQDRTDRISGEVTEFM